MTLTHTGVLIDASAPPASATAPPTHARPYSIKRHGTSITDCDSEPVQTPGCVQAHGALLVLRPGDLTIAQASENARAVLGQDAHALLNQAVASVVGAERELRLKAFLAAEPTEHNPLFVFTIVGEGGSRLDATVHSNAGVVLLEFEATGRSGNAEPAQTAGLAALAGFAEPTEPDYYALVKKTIARLRSAATLQAFCDTTAAQVRALTGLDRVMIYKFHADGHGEVFAESRVDDVAPWLGFHYPASDIPQPAREIFKRIWLRPTPDVCGALAEMVPLANPDSGAPLDMTHCALRGASVMYTEYLRNMKVTAGLTMPIRRDGELWGLIACHHYQGAKFLPYPVRAACEFLAQVVSLQHKAAEEREHLLYRLELEGVHQRLIANAARSGDLSALTTPVPTLLDAMDAGGAAVYHSDRWWCVGQTPDESQLDALATWLAARPQLMSTSRPLYATDHLAADYPAGAAFADVAAGVLALPLARGQRSLMLWFRPETIRTFNWGGNPHEKPVVTGPNGPRLTPRASFEIFVESVRERSLPWQAVQIDAAARLRVLLLELVLERAGQLFHLNAELSRSNQELDAFAYVASHDLKEPLRGIHKYAHQLLEDATLVNDEQRRKLDSLVRLTVRMDGLLDSLLHYARAGRMAIEFELCDLNLVLAEAIEMVGSRRAELQTEFVVPRPLPSVPCDWVSCREVYVNLLSNALKYNDKAEKRVEIGWIGADEDTPRPRCPPQAMHESVYYVRDNGIGIDPHLFEQSFKMFKRLHARDAYGGGTGAGLSIVEKLVERHGGQVWIDSTPGAGSTFYFSLPGIQGATS